MTLSRSLLGVLLLAALSGCGTPPGTPMPAPTDYNEQNHAQDVFRRYSPVFAKEPDVLGFYMTANNNPRHFKVIVKDMAARKRIYDKFGGNLEGIDLMVRADYEPNPGDEIVSVPKEEAPKTWWEKLIAAFAAWKTRVLAPATPQSPLPTGPVKQL